MGNCCSRFKYSESMNPRHHLSAPSPPSPMESSLPISGDPVPLTPLMGAIESIGEMYKKIDPEHIDPLISFIETHMNTLLEAGSSSSQDWLASVQDVTKLGASTIDIICVETEKLSKSYAVKEIGAVALNVMKGVGELQWVMIGLTVAAFAVEKYVSVGSRKNECTDLLLNILELSKQLKQFLEQMPDKREIVCNAVVTIVEGAFICLGDLQRGKIFRFWSAKTAAEQLEKTKQQLRDVRDYLGLSPAQKLLDFQYRKYYRGDKDVFLSHSGKQKNFVRQLHRDLTREHISCFFDEDANSLPIAQRFPPLIFKAAETCKIAVLVLSKEFIRSKWPMLELSAFISAMNSGKNANLKLLPIFFMISPKELSFITKDSPEWKKLEESDDIRGKWQDALKVVRSVNGLHFGKDENEVYFRDKVVKAICCLLRQINPGSPLELLDFKPVGIEKQVEEVKGLLDMEGAQSALAVIVCGFGGVGKSTLAASVVQSLDWSSTNFKFCRVAINENTPDKTSHIIQLQKDIIHTLEGAQFDFQDPLEGRLHIKEALKKKCSLIFIDNVVDKDYIRDLLPEDMSCGEQDLKSDAKKQKTKLRILITSREINVKAEFNINCEVYQVPTLSKPASQLLIFETIGQGRQLEDEEFDEKSMIKEVADACRGVPLLLSVFGKHLRVERHKESYEEALDILREGNLDGYRDEDLGTKLMFVYHKIKNVEVKEAFLDICTYFHGWEWNLVADIVDFSKLEDLKRRMLVSRSCSSEVIVHDILRLMGMNEANRNRFSDYKKLTIAMEDNLNGFGNVKGVSLENDNRSITIHSTQLEAMSQSLRVLKLGDWVTLDGSPLDKGFPNLRYLSVGDIASFPFKDLSKLDKLRVFLNRSKPGMNLSHLPLSLKRISHEVPHVECHKFVKLPFEDLSSLKSIIVKTWKLVELPEKLNLPSSLVDLHLNRCKNLPKDIGHLTALESLILDRSDLECLPQGLGKLKKLRYLSMNYCSKLAFLSEELGMLSSLEALSMENCRNLKSLPRSLGGLLSLQTLESSRSFNLQLLPESFGELHIRSLKLNWLVNLQELPNSFGNMPLLKDLSLMSCHSLVSLPNSFVQLKMLETLNIFECTKLSVLPENFGRLRCLKHMTIQDCHCLKHLPHGFGALPALKTCSLIRCNSFANLPRDFMELTSLEELRLETLPLMSSIPNGLGDLKNLRLLVFLSCFQLKTLPDDFENMATLERLTIRHSPELDGAMMEKILKLQNCYMADIIGSRKLSEKWENMKGESEHPIVVVSGVPQKEEQGRAIKVALLHGKYMEVGSGTNQLVESSSLLVGLAEGMRATVALIMLPIHMQLHQHKNLQLFLKMARKRAKNNRSDKLQIVCAMKYVQRSTPTEEDEKAENQGIYQILLSLPKGSCAIPSAESKRVKILSLCCCSGDKYHPDKLSFFMANVKVLKGHKIFEDLKYTEEDKISGNVVGKPENKHQNTIQNFIESICTNNAGESKSREFIQALKGNGIQYLLTNSNTSKVMVDDLHGKAVGFIICDFKFLECIKLQQIYKDLQQKDSNFIAIWIPTAWPEDCGHGTYTRLIQCMPWATFPHPQLANVEMRRPCFVLLDKHGQIANHDALPLLMGWRVKSYPFTRHTISESFSLMEYESCLEFLLQGMNIVGKKPMKRKMTFLYVERPGEWLKWHQMKSNLEELTEIHGNFEVLYVGHLYDIENLNQNYEDAIQHYEDARQDMRWPSLSFSDMIMFWYRCKYLASKEGCELFKESNIIMNILHGPALNLYWRGLLLVDNNGAVTSGGHEVVQMICKPSNAEGMTMRMVKNELMQSLSRGECSPLVRTFFTDEIHNLPQHPQHRISYSTWVKHYTCDVCFCFKYVGWNEDRSYRCDECDWDMCRSCWMVCALQQHQYI